MEKSANFILISCFAALLAINASAQETIIIRPQGINDVLINPGIGFTTFQRFNGDNWDGFQDCLDKPTATNYNQFNGPLKIDNYPLTSIAYFRILWRFIEPENGKVNFDFIDRLLKTADERHQTLILRIAPYTEYDGNTLPQWVKDEMIKANEYNQKSWESNPNSDIYVKYFSGLIGILGEHYDGNPNLESVDVALIGNAGEGVGTQLLTSEHRLALTNAYKNAFKKSQLIIMGRTDSKEKNVFWDFGTKNVDWRLDCLGDVGFEFSKTYSHMFDYYPQAINGGLQDAWKKAPIAFESCWDMEHWKEQGWDIDYIISQSLKWHISSFNSKSMPVPKKWDAKVDEWLKKMGYRLTLRRFSYPEFITSNRKISFKSWWENTGVAPCYNKNFLVAFRIKNGTKEAVMVTNVGITSWLPGDNLCDDAIFVPPNMAEGKYELQIGIVDKQSHKPKVNLAIEGRTADGWYSLGEIEIK